MRKLHLYLARRFLIDFSICLFSVLLLYVALDLSTNLKQFLKPGRGNLAGFISLYYAFRLPLLAGKLVPIAALLGAAFSLTLLERRNELTAVKAAGISMVRFTRPLVLAGVVLAGACLAIEEWVVPWAAGQVYSRDLELSDAHRWNQTVPDPDRRQYVFYSHYEPAPRRMEKIHVVRVDEAMRERENTFAAEAVFHRSGAGSWVMKDGYTIRYDERGFRVGGIERFAERALDTRLRPIDMENIARKDEPPLSALHDKWRLQPDQRNLGVQFHFRAAMPFATPFLLLLGIPAALAGAHRRFFAGALATGLLAAAYFALAFGAMRLGMIGLLPPIAAGWGPTILFASLSSALYDTAPS